MNGQREKKKVVLESIFSTEKHRKQKNEKFKLYKCRARLLAKKW